MSDKTRRRIYKILNGMRQRCYNPKNIGYPDYGGRGIKVCENWLGKEGYHNFYEWALNNGYGDELSIDRIDSDGNYEPSNCKWSTPKEQANNRRNNTRITINGVTKNMKEWEIEYGLSENVILNRLRLGWEGEDLLKPVKSAAEKQSGVKNITWNNKKECWQVIITEHGKLKNIGSFKELDDAIKAKEEYLKERDIK